MANPEHLAILKQGVAMWNEWREKTTKKIDLSEINFNVAEFSEVIIPEEPPCDVDLSNATLRGADLSGADLSRTNLTGSDLTEAYFDEANLSSANLSGAILIGAHICEANLRAANLSGADLTGANLRGSDLTGADLSAADLSGAYIIGANLFEAYLGDANFSEAMLIRTNIHSSNLSGTDLTTVILGGIAFADIDLSTTLGLESVHHHYPSTIGIDTLYKSKGQIPEVFLRGCGVPDSFISQAMSLIGAEDWIQFYSCFISYSGLDEEFARRLYGRLQQEHVRVWFAPHDIQGGKKLHEQIDEAIKVYDKLLILLSPNSLKSEWVMTELRKARKAERKTGKRKLFPVGLVDYATLQDWECFDADGGKDLAVEVREYFIPDFSNWKDHDAFEKGFERLLKDLRAEEKAVG